MGGPKEKFENRPKKSGTKKRQKVRAQKRRLVKAGLDEGVVEKMTTREVREAHKDALKKKLCMAIFAFSIVPYCAPLIVG